MNSYRPHIAENTGSLKSVGAVLCAWRNEPALDCGKQQGGMFKLNDTNID